MKKKIKNGVSILICVLTILFGIGLLLVNQDEKSFKLLQDEINSIEII